mmetsp:Transcript_30784/g.35111  ORF Transcript_30784/g.35111 Transcript_30784/m.35111 type:complete len:422 (-) Transcript_30784:29-1294(-)
MQVLYLIASSLSALILYSNYADTTYFYEFHTFLQLKLNNFTCNSWLQSCLYLNFLNQRALLSESNEYMLERRKFISYHSSPWEEYWFENIGILQGKICSTILTEQTNQLRAYLELLCTRYFPPHDNWCIIDDGYAPLWFNIANKESLDITFEKPLPLIVDATLIEPSIPYQQHEHILSKFTYVDEVTKETYNEYIEPLVGNLFFPLQKCLHPAPIIPFYKNHYVSFRGWLTPPPVVRGDRALLFDFSSSKHKISGPTIQYLINTWSRHGVAMDQLWILYDNNHALSAHRVRIYEDVPVAMTGVTHFKHPRHTKSLEQKNTREKESPFFLLLQFIQQHSTKNDYVILKLDETTDLAGGQFLNHPLIQYMKSQDNQIDEVIWEAANSETSFLLGDEATPWNLTLLDSYDLLLTLRRNGIRAHA